MQEMQFDLWVRKIPHAVPTQIHLFLSFECLAKLFPTKTVKLELRKWREWTTCILKEMPTKWLQTTYSALVSGS